MIALLIKNWSLETWIKIFGWVKLQESQTLVWPRPKKTLNTKTATFWYILYIPILEKVQERKILETEYKTLMNTVSKIHPHILYILGDMIPSNQGSILSLDSSLNRTPRENCYISGYEGPNEILKMF